MQFYNFLLNIEIGSEEIDLSNMSVSKVEKMLIALRDFAISFGKTVLVALIIYFIGKKLIKYIMKILNKSFERAGTELTVAKFTKTLVRTSLNVILLLIVLDNLGIVDPSSLGSLIASAGLAIGLALKESLANFAGGVIILLLKPYKVGDYIIEDSKGNEGVVHYIGLFATTLLTIDNKQIVVPNATLANTSVTNVTAQEYRRLDMKVGISYGADLKMAKDVFMKLIERDESILQDRDKIVYVDELADSAVVLGARMWVRSEDYWATKWRMLENIKLEYDKNSIEIPFNQVDVNVKSV